MNLSEDGKRVAFLTADGDKNFIVRDGETVAEYESFDVNWPMAMSADGETLAWSGNYKDRGEVVVNGKELRGYREVQHVAVSANGKTVAFAARRKADAWFIVINEREGPEFESISNPVISADGTTVGYEDDDGRLRIGDRTLPIPSGFSRFHLSPDGRVIVFQRREKTGEPRRFLEWDGRRGPSFSEIEAPSFAPDGKTFVFGAREGDRSLVVVGERTWETPDRISRPTFNADGTQIGYGALIGREILWKVIEAR